MDLADLFMASKLAMAAARLVLRVRGVTTAWMALIKPLFCPRPADLVPDVGGGPLEPWAAAKGARDPLGTAAGTPTTPATLPDGRLDTRDSRRISGVLKSVEDVE